ncbi:HAD family hydrolase [Motilimonas pumila]|uniref:HAD family hydrolase n=2 Tax=Motilimonas pumila TaxID=2303987 RepID=A0A418YBH1_9GAMM|nr:HAD family hydrolase [Motilimonas pumila]
MVDFADQQGKMCHWQSVQAVDGAKPLLARISQHHSVYIATNAVDSDVADIQQAFERAQLAEYIDGYFCHANVGIGKGSAEFFHRIAASLKLSTESMVMVGDSIENDIVPALDAGLDAIWFNPKGKPDFSQSVGEKVQQVSALCQIAPRI